MLTKRTVKVGKEHFLEYIDDYTENRIEQIPLDEAEYKDETIKLFTENHVAKNPGVSYSEALLAVSETMP